MTETTASIDPLRSIWLHPRRTLRYILDTDPRRYLWLLAALTGVKGAFDAGIQSEPLYNMGFGPWSIALAAVVLGPLLGIGLVHLYAWLYKVTGRWFGGQGTVRTLAAAVAWASVPVVAVLPLDMLAGFVLPHGSLVVHASATADAGSLLFTGWNAPSLVHATDMLASVWSFVLTLHTVGEANGYSAWMTLVNIIVLAVVLFVVILLGSIILGVLLAMGGLLS